MKNLSANIIISDILDKNFPKLNNNELSKNVKIFPYVYNIKQRYKLLQYNVFLEGYISFLGLINNYGEYVLSIVQDHNDIQYLSYLIYNDFKLLLNNEYYPYKIIDNNLTIYDINLLPNNICSLIKGTDKNRIEFFLKNGLDSRYKYE